MEEFKDILPVKGFFMEDALEDLFQSKTLLEKSVEQMVNSKISKAPRADGHSAKSPEEAQGHYS